VKRDRFDLLHGLRKIRLDACRLQLASVDHCADVLETQVRELVHAVDSALTQHRQAVSAGGVDVGSVVEYRRRRHELRGGLGMLSRRQSLVNEVAGLARANLREAVRQVEVIEKLVEKTSG